MLRQLLSYDADTGIFHWKERKKGRQLMAGGISGRYHTIFIDGKSYYSHRLAWFYITGEWPDKDIDHINGDCLDNRFHNLRVATRSQNLNNCKVRKDNTSGIKNVSFCKQTNKWIVRISTNKKRKHLGYFATAEEAEIVAKKAAKQLHGQFARPE